MEQPCRGTPVAPPAPRVRRRSAEPLVVDTRHLPGSRPGVVARHDRCLDAIIQLTIEIADSNGPSTGDPRIVRIVVDAVQDAKRHGSRRARKTLEPTLKSQSARIAGFVNGQSRRASQADRTRLGPGLTSAGREIRSRR